MADILFFILPGQNFSKFSLPKTCPHHAKNMGEKKMSKIPTLSEINLMMYSMNIPDHYFLSFIYF